jgi:Rrf2 family protein
MKNFLVWNSNPFYIGDRIVSNLESPYNMFSNACIYGIQAMIYVAMQQKEEQFIPIATIAQELAIPFQFLKKILQKLAEQSILHSQRSAKGGVKLARSADTITVFDIIAAIDGVDLLTTQCILNMPGCGNHTPCPLHALWGIERARLRRLFESSTLQDLAQKTVDLDLRLGMSVLQEQEENRGITPMVKD